MKTYLRILLTPFVAYLLMGPVAAHRAYYQVTKVEIVPAVSDLFPGLQFEARAVTSGRTMATLVVELEQGGSAQAVVRSEIRANRWRFWDPRRVYTTESIVLTDRHIAPFSSGPATLRVTGHGRSQWLRVPPPVVREYSVRIP